MRTTFEQRLEGLEAKLLELGQLLQAQLDRTLAALDRFDATLADQVIVGDDQIDRGYVEVEQEILRTLALQAPVAGDLRLVAGVLHVNAHLERMGDLCYLERIGDHAVDIGEQVVLIVTGEVRELVPSKALRAGVEQ